MPNLDSAFISCRYAYLASGRQPQEFVDLLGIATSSKTLLRILIEYDILDVTMGYLDTYNRAHTHPANRALHAVGIPAILLSLPLLLFDWRWGVALFVIGWILQFVGHYIEGKPPAFFSNPLYLVVGPYWLLRKALFKPRKKS